MSAEASLWCEPDGWTWKAVHDGECMWPDRPHEGVLSDVIREVEACLGHVGSMRWEMAELKSETETAGLRLLGYIW